MNSSVIITGETSRSTPGTVAQATKVLASGNAEQITATQTYFQRITFFGYKSFSSGTPTDNASTVNIGIGSTYLPWELAAGAELNITAPVGQKLDLSTFYVKGTSTDGVHYVIL